MTGHTPDNPALFPAVPEHLANLIVRYYDDNLSKAQADELREGLMNSPAARDLFVHWGLQIQTLTESLAPQYSDTDEPIPFAELAEMEANAHAPLVELVDLRVTWYRKHATPLLAAAGIALAAVIALGVILMVGPTNNPSPGNTPIATDTNTTPAQRDELPRQTVATITAEHDAKWATSAGVGSPAPDLTPGSPLQAGDRLTLTAGYAEITTNDGAIAILQAPTTIELTNSDNAIELHAGKLVGICETPSSKGFLVRTPHMDITDLGTRFGVNVSEYESTEVHVYQGEVEVVVGQQTSGANAIRRRLTHGQAVHASAGQAELSTIQLDESILNPTMLPGIFSKVLTMTGLGLSKGQADPLWRVIAIDGNPVTQGGEMRGDTNTVHGGYGDVDPMFLKIDQSLFPANAQSAVFTCRSTFNVPSDVDSTAYRLAIWIEGDHRVNAVRINGQPLTIPPNRTQVFRLDTGLSAKPGDYQIEVDVEEFRTNKAFRSGLRAKIALEPIAMNNFFRPPLIGG